jgi:hypothetical protein
MAIRKLNPHEWEAFFDAYSKRNLMDRQPEYADLRVLSKTRGHLEATQWLPLRGITYDPANDIVEIILEDLDHMITHPAEIYVDENGHGDINSMEIISRDGDKQILEVR